MSILEVEHIQKSFERTEVLKDISFLWKKVRYFLLSVLPAVEKRLFCVV